MVDKILHISSTVDIAKSSNSLPEHKTTKRIARYKLIFLAFTLFALSTLFAYYCWLREANKDHHESELLTESFFSSYVTANADRAC